MSDDQPAVDASTTAPAPDAASDLARDLLARAKADARAAGGTPNRRSGARRRTAPDRRTGPGTDPRDPQLLGPLVDELVASRGWEASAAVGGVEARWPVVVGPQLADHCRPEAYADGVLTVRAESTAWATQLRMLAPTLVARLNADLGDGTVTRVTVLGPDGPTWRKGRLRVKGRGPRDTYG